VLSVAFVTPKLGKHVAAVMESASLSKDTLQQLYVADRAHLSS
jgi:hypothetical protein